MKAMRVLLVPARLKLATTALFLCVPIAAFETIVATRAPWWRLPYATIGVWSASVFLTLLPLAAWMTRGRAWAARSLELFLAVWVILSAWVALRTGNSGLAFMALLLLALFGTWIVWVRHELGRSFFDPRMRWYQGLPRAFPGISCRVSWGDREIECKVSRLDREGAFVFQPGGEEPRPLRAEGRSELVFSFRELTVRCAGVPVRTLRDNRGAGYQFEGLAPDLRKQLGDFIEVLKGEGYVLE